MIAEFFSKRIHYKCHTYFSESEYFRKTDAQSSHGDLANRKVLKLSVTEGNTLSCIDMHTHTHTHFVGKIHIFILSCVVFVLN